MKFEDTVTLFRCAEEAFDLNPIKNGIFGYGAFLQHCYNIFLASCYTTYYFLLISVMTAAMQASNAICWYSGAILRAASK